MAKAGAAATSDQPTSRSAMTPWSAPRQATAQLQPSAACGNVGLVTLDPIVSLSVAVAEAPGSYALLLGSGVSRDAGVPTGRDVFWRAVAELYRVEQVSDETPGEEELAAWLAES